MCALAHVRPRLHTPPHTLQNTAQRNRPIKPAKAHQSGSLSRAGSHADRTLATSDGHQSAAGCSTCRSQTPVSCICSILTWCPMS